MNQSLETITNEKYKPLIYILPHQASSLQETISSAVNTIATVEENNQRDATVLETLKTRSWMTLEVVNPFAFYFLKAVADVLAKRKNSTDNNENEEETNRTEINNLLNELDLGDWSDFITQIPYPSIPETFDFPPGHPLPGKLYRVHPLKSKNNKYIPIEVFDSLLYAEREGELIRLLTDLGATQIKIREKKGGQKTTEISASAELIGTGGLENTIGGEINKSDESIRSLSLGGNPWSPEIVEKFDETNYSWLAYEPAWSAIVHSRLYGKCLTASIELANDDSYSISGKLGLAEGLLKNLAGLDAGGTLSRNQTKTSLVSVEFAPAIEN